LWEHHSHLSDIRCPSELAPYRDCRWHPNRLPGFKGPNPPPLLIRVSIFSCSRHAESYIVGFCDVKFGATGASKFEAPVLQVRLALAESPSDLVVHRGHGRRAGCSLWGRNVGYQRLGGQNHRGDAGGVLNGRSCNLGRVHDATL